jgi:3-hydroxyacyl-CoA dehydrogenase
MEIQRIGIVGCGLMGSGITGAGLLGRKSGRGFYEYDS